MCHKCKNTCCTGCESDSSNQNESSNQTNQEIAYLGLPGRPIIHIDDPDDLAAFDQTTGLGSGVWLGWAICNGNSYTDANTGATVATTNFMNRTLVGAGDQYVVGNQFGQDSVQLTDAQNGAHNHTLTDPGHTHVITDPGHTHVVTDPGHTHTVTDAGHTHPVVNTMALSKNVATASNVESDIDVLLGAGADVPDTWTQQTIDLVGSVTVSSATTGVTNANSSTGVTNETTPTGVTNSTVSSGITLADSGVGEEHENRQPSSAVLIVKRIYVPA